MSERTDWTKMGYRLDVDGDGPLLILTVEAAYAERSKGALGTVVMSKIAVPTGSLKADALNFVRHALSYYGDEELTALGGGAVMQMYAGLKEPAPDAPPEPSRADAN